MPFLLFAVLASNAGAQWLHYPTPGTPRTREGKPDLGAPAPKKNGKPDLSGVWQIEPTPLEELKRLFGNVDGFDVPGDDATLYSKYFLSVLADYKAGEAPLLPSAAETLQRHLKHDSADLPYTRCLPGGVRSARRFRSRSKSCRPRG